MDESLAEAIRRENDKRLAFAEMVANYWRWPAEQAKEG